MIDRILVFLRWLGGYIIEFQAKQAINHLKSRGYNDNGWREAVTEGSRKMLFGGSGKKGHYKVFKAYEHKGDNL